MELGQILRANWNVLNYLILLKFEGIDEIDKNWELLNYLILLKFEGIDEIDKNWELMWICLFCEKCKVLSEFDVLSENVYKLRICFCKRNREK